MEHALGLARKGIGLASPNPTVGCVIVRDGQIVGEGFHQYEWRDHAEIVALKSAGEKARGATLYVTLEPCNHKGRTGPCTEAIIAAGVQRVVAAMQDPNPVNSGRGFELLGQTSIEVVTDIFYSFRRRASASQMSVTTSMLVWPRSSTPRPELTGFGSCIAATTRCTPAAMIASVHGPVRPLWLHGSSVTYNVAPRAFSPADFSATISAWSRHSY